MCLDCLLNGDKVRIINVYLRTHGDVTSKKQLVKSLSSMLDCNFYLIIGGDFNFVDNPVLDKIFPSGKPSKDEDNAVRQIFDEFKIVYGLTDMFLDCVILQLNQLPF
jgi:hypothetical protein